jgi:hypothetical protein
MYVCGPFGALVYSIIENCLPAAGAKPSLFRVAQAVLPKLPEGNVETFCELRGSEREDCHRNKVPASPLFFLELNKPHDFTYAQWRS